MNRQLKMGIAGVYALAVIISGSVRFFFAEGGSTGLIFGCVMGMIGLVAAASIAIGRTTLGSIIAVITTLFVGGWFCYESFVKKGIEQAELRQLIMIGVSGLTLGLLLLPTSGKPSAVENEKAPPN